MREGQSVTDEAGDALPQRVIEALDMRLLLDSRVVDVPMAYNPIVVPLSSLKAFFFNGLKRALHFSDNIGA